MSLSLHWFRSDLRVHDNTALHAAARQGPVAALYIATPAQWRAHDDAPIKQDYWRRALHALEQELRLLGITLYYAEVPGYADIPALLGPLLVQWSVTQLHCNREYAFNESRRDDAVGKLCGELGVQFYCHDDQCLLRPERLLNKSGEPFKVFTPFARTARSVLRDNPPAVVPVPQAQNAPALKRPAPCCTLQELSWPSCEPTWDSLWPATETKVLQNLQRFMDSSVHDYQRQRDLPAVSGTSRLSPALAAGVLSPRQCWQASLRVEAGEGSLNWQNELLWRDYYKHVLWHFPWVNKGYQWRRELDHVPWRHDEDDFRAWREGRTGFPLVDAAMRQLLETGWMHNRLRMLTAMFLSKHLLIDWRWGERWFMQHLVDGDFSANNGGWQWSASTGTDAAPYFRIFNPVTQSRRFDPEGTFIRRYVPELADLDADSIHEPGLLRPGDYPAPMIDLGFGRERALAAFKRQ